MEREDSERIILLLELPCLYISTSLITQKRELSGLCLRTKLLDSKFILNYSSENARHHIHNQQRPNRALHQ